MADFTSLAKTSELPPGTKKAVFVGGKRIMLANADDHIFAMDSVCSHAQCSLVQEGSLEGETIICHCHGSQFDLKTGSVLNPPATRPMHVYDVKIEGDSIMVAV